MPRLFSACALLVRSALDGYGPERLARRLHGAVAIDPRREFVRDAAAHVTAARDPCRIDAIDVERHRLY